MLSPRFRLAAEQLLSRGLSAKFVAIWVFLTLMVLLGALAALIVAGDRFGGFLDAAWWAFLRLTDPGHLSEDNVRGLRIVSVVLTVGGLAVFVGALIAVITQWLDQTMGQLALGMTPIRDRGHVVVLGWTERTAEILAGLLGARGGGLGGERVAVLVDRITPELVQEVRARVGQAYDSRRIILRSGDPLQFDHLARVNVRQASAVIVPGIEDHPRGHAWRDPATLGIVANLARAARRESVPPRLAVEVFDPGLAAVVRSSYPGEVYVVPSDLAVGRAMAHGVISPGLSVLLEDLWDPRAGCTVRLVRSPALVGLTVREAVARFPTAIVVGVTRAVGGGSYAAPRVDGAATIGADDRVMLLAPIGEPPAPVEAPALDDRSWPADWYRVGHEARRVLVLGYSRRVAHLLVELARHTGLDHEVDVVDTLSVAEREQALAPFSGRVRARVNHIVADPAVPSTFEGLVLDGYGTIVLFDSEARIGDAFTVTAQRILASRLAGLASPPHVIIELQDPANAAIYLDGERGSSRMIEVVQPARMVASALSGLIAEADLRGLIGPIAEGSLGVVDTVPLDGLAGQLDLGRLESELRARGMVLIGLQRAVRRFAPELSPDRREPVSVAPGDRAVVFRSLDPATGSPNPEALP